MRPPLTIDFELRGDSVALCDLLKLAGLVDSGGQGKTLAASGAVRVDGHAETRKTAKIRAGQVVDYDGARITVRAANERL